MCTISARKDYLLQLCISSLLLHDKDFVFLNIVNKINLKYCESCCSKGFNKWMKPKHLKQLPCVLRYYIKINSKSNRMKSYQILLVSLFLLVFTSCEVVGGIFQAGMWVGVLAVVVVIALIIWLIRRAGGKR